MLFISKWNIHMHICFTDAPSQNMNGRVKSNLFKLEKSLLSGEKASH